MWIIKEKWIFITVLIAADLERFLEGFLLMLFAEHPLFLTWTFLIESKNMNVCAHRTGTIPTHRYPAPPPNRTH